MKNLGLYLLGIVLVAAIASCDSNQIDCIRASSNIISEARDIKDYKGVAVNINGDLKVTQGPEYAFNIHGPDNVVSLTKSEVQNEILVIGSDKCFNGSYDLRVEITAPDFNLISLIGNGNIEVINQLDVDIIEFQLLGNGEIEASLIADSLYTTISGNGNVTYSGEVTKHSLVSSGQFALSSYPLTTQHTFINLTGVGDSYVTANESLTVMIAGQGDVYYKGIPQINSDIIGEGSVIDSN